MYLPEINDGDEGYESDRYLQVSPVTQLDILGIKGEQLDLPLSLSRSLSLFLLSHLSLTPPSLSHSPSLSLPLSHYLSHYLPPSLSYSFSLSHTNFVKYTCLNPSMNGARYPAY